MSRIVPLDLGMLRNRPKESITFGVGAGTFVDLVCLGWLIVGDGAPILVDTGPLSAANARAEHDVELTKDASQQLGVALAANGVNAEDVALVVLTHLHWDHCQCLHEVPNARVVVQERELEYAQDPADRDRIVYEHGRHPPFLAERKRLTPVSGQKDVAPGVRVVPTPGHSPGHQSVLVETGMTRYLIAGDHFGLYENCRLRCPSGPTVDVPSWQRSFDCVVELGGVPLPGHDLDVLRASSYE